jgi:NADH:ubiquinone oxidoreductase subunit 6 (subunit J)
MPMTFMEKSNWVVLVVAVPTLLLYVALVLPQVLGTPIAEVSWVQPMIFAIVGFIVANVLGNVVAAASNPGEADKNDQRDREIDQFGERVGNWLMIAGSIAALVLAMAMANHFWIANAIFLGGMAASIVSSVTKIAAYRGSFQTW